MCIFVCASVHITGRARRVHRERRDKKELNNPDNIYGNYCWCWESFSPSHSFVEMAWTNELFSFFVFSFVFFSPFSFRTIFAGVYAFLSHIFIVFDLSSFDYASCGGFFSFSVFIWFVFCSYLFSGYRVIENPPDDFSNSIGYCRDISLLYLSLPPC